MILSNFALCSCVIICAEIPFFPSRVGKEVWKAGVCPISFMNNKEELRSKRKLINALDKGLDIR
jgi:hypothetical protein